MTAPDKPFAFLQWKNTEACIDFHCDCGAFGHYDGFFAVAVRCPKCGAAWELPHILVPKKMGPDFVGVPMTLEIEEEET